VPCTWSSEGSMRHGFGGVASSCRLACGASASAVDSARTVLPVRIDFSGTPYYIICDTSVRAVKSSSQILRTATTSTMKRHTSLHGPFVPFAASERHLARTRYVFAFPSSQFCKYCSKGNLFWRSKPDQNTLTIPNITTCHVLTTSKLAIHTNKNGHKLA
jgi:hypothetical protein